jgi:hypothetical protein
VIRSRLVYRQGFKIYLCVYIQSEVVAFLLLDVLLDEPISLRELSGELNYPGVSLVKQFSQFIVTLFKNFHLGVKY